MATKLNKYQTERLVSRIEGRRLRRSAFSGGPLGTASGLIVDVALAVSPAVTTDILASAISTTNTVAALSPLNLFAAAELGAGNLFFTYPVDGTCRINHTASTQSRLFRAMLLFSFVFLLFAGGASAQVIQDDGVALEVRPALNFTTNISCSNDADSTNCATTAFPFGFGTIGNAVADAAADTLTVTDDAAGFVNFTTTDNPEDLTATIFANSLTAGQLAPNACDASEIAINSVTLATDTVGNFLLSCSTAAGSGLTGCPAASEGAADAPLAFFTGDIGTDPALGVGGASFSSEGASAAGLVFEGDTSNAFELRMRVTDPTAERILTVPNADSTTVQPDAGAANNFLTAISASGVVSKAQPSTSNLSDFSDVMLESVWSTGATYGFGIPYVDFAEVAESSVCVDVNSNGVCEFGGVAGFSLFFDYDEDGTADFGLVAGDIATFFGGGSFASSINALGTVIAGSDVRAEDGLWVGNGTNVNLANASAIGRETATDRLFSDRDGDFATVQTRETNTAGIERYLENDNELLRMTADYDNATTTGTEITGLQVSVNGARTYDVTYHLLVQSTSASFATTGIEFGVNYTTGTPAPFICRREVPTDDVVGAAATGLEEDVHVGGTTGKAYEYWVTQTEQTTAPDLGPTAGFLTPSASVMEEIHCILTTAAGAGDIELWAASSSANNVRVKAQSWVNVVTVQ